MVYRYPPPPPVLVFDLLNFTTQLKCGMSLYCSSLKCVLEISKKLHTELTLSMMSAAWLCRPWQLIVKIDKPFLVKMKSRCWSACCWSACTQRERDRKREREKEGESGRGESQLLCPPPPTMPRHPYLYTQAKPCIRSAAPPPLLRRFPSIALRTDADVQRNRSPTKRAQ